MKNRYGNYVVGSMKTAYNTVVNNNNILGVVSSVAEDGKTINLQTSQDGEVRDAKLLLPFGISSSATNGMRAQIIDNNTVCGVIDNRRPFVKYGEVMVYNHYGSQIYLKDDGSITINGNNNINININSDEIKLRSYNNNITINNNGIHLNGNVKINGNTL